MKGLGPLGPFWPGQTDVQYALALYISSALSIHKHTNKHTTKRHLLVVHWLTFRDICGLGSISVLTYRRKHLFIVENCVAQTSNITDISCRLQ